MAGYVTMDQLMADCGDREPSLGDEVVLVGTQADAAITAQQLADHAGTIAYEIVSRVGARVPRRYVP